MVECIQAEEIHVLVVEDSPGDTRLLQEACTHSASHFHYVKNGEEALDYLYRRGSFASAQRPDLIILDLRLPRIDGIEVIIEIKKDAELRHVPVIVFSSSNSDDEIREAYGAHVACVVKKPHNLDEFIEVCQGIARFWLEFVCYPARIG
jgi:CheY-like chemotaxis protein